MSYFFPWGVYSFFFIPVFLHSCKRRLGCTDIRVRVKNASGGCVNAVNNASTCHCNWCVHAGLVFCHFKNIYVCIKGIKAPVLVRHVLKIYAAQWPHCWPFTRVNQLNRESCAVVTSFKITQVYNSCSCTGLFLTRRIQSSWRKKMLWKSKIQNLLRCNHLNSFFWHSALQKQDFHCSQWTAVPATHSRHTSVSTGCSTSAINYIYVTTITEICFCLLD